MNCNKHRRRLPCQWLCCPEDSMHHRSPIVPLPSSTRTEMRSGCILSFPSYSLRSCTHLHIADRRLSVLPRSSLVHAIVSSGAFRRDRVRCLRRSLSCKGQTGSDRIVSILGNGRESTIGEEAFHDDASPMDTHVSALTHHKCSQSWPLIYQPFRQLKTKTTNGMIIVGIFASDSSSLGSLLKTTSDYWAFPQSNRRWKGKHPMGILVKATGEK